MPSSAILTSDDASKLIKVNWQDLERENKPNTIKYIYYAKRPKDGDVYTFMGRFTGFNRGILKILGLYFWDKKYIDVEDLEKTGENKVEIYRLPQNGGDRRAIGPKKPPVNENASENRAVVTDVNFY